MKFADVLLPLPLSRYFTYAVPSEMQECLRIGSRVVVPFGRKKYYTAIVVFLHDHPTDVYEIKEIFSLLDEVPILRRPQLKFWEWIASYYLCSVGDVYKAALPSGLKLESESCIMLNDDYEEIPKQKLSSKERDVLNVLSGKGKCSISELEKISGIKNLMPTVRTLLEKEAVYMYEQLKEGYRPKTENYIRLCFGQEQQAELKELFDTLASAKKQLNLLMAYLDLSGFMRKKEFREVSKKELTERAGVSAAVMKALIDKKIFVVYKNEISRFTDMSCHTVPTHELSQAQQQAYKEIIDSFVHKDVSLLQGVTSSGKTEIYIHLIQEILRKGRQVLYLVPEIALTTQLTSRLQRIFGSQLVIYHSKFSENERAEIWNNMLRTNDVKIVLGVRSSIFLPFTDLGLVIVDEEHEKTYKQQDPAPRYHARNAAIVLASMHGAKTLLGSATPAIESYYNAMTGKYGWVSLTQRYDDISLPEIKIADLQQFRKKKQMSGTFSPLLIKQAKEGLERGEQVILFQNRRGFAPVMECKLCAWIPKCRHCDVTLTYHKRQNQLTCHYCGAVYDIPHICPACGQPSIEIKGYGTERIEEEIAAIFPDYSVSRLDLDSTRTRKAYEQIINQFQQKKMQILIGTQMVTKGLDFDNVSVVGILNADGLMNYPDFRAYERAFQLMVQVAGRAGRKNKRGTVILQTANPAHPLIRQIVNNDYEAMYNNQIEERKQFNYPPFSRLIHIFLKHRDETLLFQYSTMYADYLRKIFKHRILGPDNPPVSRIQSLYIRTITLKIENQASMSRVKELLQQAYENLLQVEGFKTVILYYDVDPL
ncbi:MAG: primosomal protein N' [Bacteroidaceae bacterium]|nr:primosomal protein N' [Bacteroidaceae bacterium]